MQKPNKAWPSFSRCFCPTVSILKGRPRCALSTSSFRCLRKAGVEDRKGINRKCPSESVCIYIYMIIYVCFMMFSKKIAGIDPTYQVGLKAQADKPGDTSVGVETAVWDRSTSSRAELNGLRLWRKCYRRSSFGREERGRGSSGKQNAGHTGRQGDKWEHK